MKFVILFLLMNSLCALEVDSKLLGTVIKMSETKKTILINKGSEHGVRKDLHAKFSVPSGMVARGVAVKVSPSRSVWSLYRIWKKDSIEREIALLLKISKAVKLTSDETKSLGVLAERVDKKTETLEKDPKFKKKQRALAKGMIQTQRKTSAYSDVDFSSLEPKSTGDSAKKDPSVDWSSLDGKNDGDYFDKSLDYSKLK